MFMNAYLLPRAWHFLRTLHTHDLDGTEKDTYARNK
jgi:hypothetical protein